MSHRILLCAHASLSLLATCSPAPEPAPDEERGAWGPRGAPSSRGLASSAFLAPGYCFSSGGSTTYEYIQDISFTQNANATLTILVDIFITNPSGCTAGNPCPVYDDSPEYVNVWIDWNDDGSRY